MKFLQLMSLLFLSYSVSAQETIRELPENPERELRESLRANRPSLDHNVTLDSQEYNRGISAIDDMSAKATAYMYTSNSEVFANILSDSSVGRTLTASASAQPGIEANNPTFFSSIFSKYIYGDTETRRRWEGFSFVGFETSLLSVKTNWHTGGMQNHLNPRARRMRALVQQVTNKRVACQLGLSVDQISPYNRIVRNKLLQSIEQDKLEAARLIQAQNVEDTRLSAKLLEGINNDPALINSPDKKKLLEAHASFVKYRQAMIAVAQKEFLAIEIESQALVDELLAPCNPVNTPNAVQNSQRRTYPTAEELLRTLQSNEQSPVSPAGSAQ